MEGAEPLQNRCGRRSEGRCGSAADFAAEWRRTPLWPLATTGLTFLYSALTPPHGRRRKAPPPPCALATRSAPWNPQPPHPKFSHAGKS